MIRKKLRFGIGIFYGILCSQLFAIDIGFAWIFQFDLFLLDWFFFSNLAWLFRLLEHNYGIFHLFKLRDLDSRYSLNLTISYWSLFQSALGGGSFIIVLLLNLIWSRLHLSLEHEHKEFELMTFSMKIFKYNYIKITLKRTKICFFSSKEIWHPSFLFESYHIRNYWSRWCMFWSSKRTVSLWIKDDQKNRFTKFILHANKKWWLVDVSVIIYDE